MAIGVDRVQVLKTESAALGGDAADSAPFPLSPEEINPQEDAIETCGVFFQEASARDEQVTIYRDANKLYYADQTTGYAGTLFPTSGGSADFHKLLVLFDSDGPAESYASNAFREVTGTVFPTAVIWWTSAAKTAKIVEKLITWTGVTATTVQWKIYTKVTGAALLATVTDTIVYSGVFETSRTRVIA